MLQLPNGARLEGDEEIVYRTIDLEQAGGDGLYAADIAESTGLSEPRVQVVLASLVDQEILAAGARDDALGPRYVRSRAS